MTSVREKIAKLQRLADSTTFPAEREEALRRITALREREPVQEPRSPLADIRIRVRRAPVDLRGKKEIGEWLDALNEIMQEDGGDITIDDIFNAARRSGL